MQDFKTIKEQYNCIDVALNRLGLQLRQAGSGDYRGKSIAPGEHSTDDALSVTSDSWFDFSSKIGGSVLDLVAFVKYGDNNAHSLCEAAKFLTGNEYDSDYGQKYTQQRDKFRTDIQTAHEALLHDERTLDYLHSRRISDATIERFTLGLIREGLQVNSSFVHEWRLAVPYKDRSGNPVYMVTRKLDWCTHEGSPKYHKSKQNDFLKNCPFGMNTLPAKNADCETLSIGEGFVDGLTMAQEGYPALFSGGGFFGKDNEAIVVREARRFRQLLTCFDSDSAGQGFTCHMGRLFLHERLNFYCVNGYGEGCKDVSDFYCTGGNIQELTRKAVNGYVFMAQRTFWHKQGVTLLSEDYPFHSLSPNEQAKRLNEVKQFIYNLKTFLEPIAFAEVIETLCEYYPKDKIAKYTEGPTANEVLCSMRDSFLNERKLFFHGTIKYGEYWQYDSKHGYWYRMTDADMQAEISEFFKHELDNKTLAQLSTKIRIIVTLQVMPEFNKKRVQVFTNGTLELDTGILREHNPDDFMTWAHGFDYDAEATCPEYDTFLQQVSINEQSRIDFLDDLAAYCMYENCRLEKMFILIGDGENGKGTFLKTLEALFSNSNERGGNTPSVTNVQPKDFATPTQRILLEGSMLNIAHDINPKLKDCASYLKSITSGDTIDGNRKFCDAHSFTPRTKIVCSSNHMLKVNDESYGMRRRLMFCKFAACFKGKADVHLLKKLKAELPGIFNRVYRAYKALLEREKTEGNNAIRESIDNDAYLAEFTNIANPVAAFWTEHGEDFITHSEVLKSELFDVYKEFCERNNLFAGRENEFHSNLKKVFQENGIQYEEVQRTRTIGNTKSRLRVYIFTKSQANQE